MESKSAYKKIDDGRYRETYGMYYNEFNVGDIFEHRPGRTLNEADNTWMSLLCMNPSPLHIDAAYCEHTEFKKPIVSSLVTFSIIMGMSVNSTSAKGVANLGFDKIRLLAPCFAGDTLYAESTILSKRLSSSRENQGLITCETRGYKSDGILFLTLERTFLVHTKASDIDDRAKY